MQFAHVHVRLGLKKSHALLELSDRGCALVVEWRVCAVEGGAVRADLADLGVLPIAEGQVTVARAY